MNRDIIIITGDESRGACLGIGTANARRIIFTIDRRIKKIIRDAKIYNMYPSYIIKKRGLQKRPIKNCIKPLHRVNNGIKDPKMAIFHYFLLKNKREENKLPF